jgi:NADPH:quinone reductase-like Zn-dependent oxidoreductase
MSDSGLHFDSPVVKGKLMSRALCYRSSWDLSISKIPIPVDINEHQILVRVKAVSINPIDVLLLRFSLPFLGSRQKVVGGDYSGIVVKAGEKSRFSQGDSVYGYRLAPMSINGTFSEYIVVDPTKDIFCDNIPDGMIFEQAASTPCVAATGYGILKYGLHKGDNRRIKESVEGALEGKKVFIIGAGTSVGSYAVEFAKKYMSAAKVVVTCSSRSEQRLEQSGADITINYTDGDAHNVNDILEFVKLHGKFDIIVDCVRNYSYMEYLHLILKDPKEGGAYCTVYGVNAMNLYSCSIWSVILPNYEAVKYAVLYAFGYFKFPIYSFKLSYDPTLSSAIRKMWEAKEFQTPIDSIFRGWTQYDLALHRVGTSKASGKVVCII